MCAYQEKLEKLCSAITSGKSGVGDIIIFATHSKKRGGKKRKKKKSKLAKKLKLYQTKTCIRWMWQYCKTWRSQAGLFYEPLDTNRGKLLSPGRGEKRKIRRNHKVTRRGILFKKKKKSPVKHFQIKTPHVASCVAFRVNIYVVEGEERWKRFGVGSRASVWRQWLKQDLAVITRVAGITHTAQLPHKFKPSHLSETVVFV